jgi:alkylation response protein AidB-like acyl-CoA dehydrogenase
MQTYQAPLRDMRFVLHELLGDETARRGVPPSEFSPELVDTVLEEAGKFLAETLLPINASGDEEGCRLENGVVRTPTGFKEAYKAYCEAGWAGSSCDPKYGGQGMPETVGKMLEEMTSAVNLSFGLYPGLTRGAYESILGFASEELKDLYLPKMVSGEWSGTMCLTEAHCGTDLGLLRTKAVPADDGTYRITGSKIFISAGEHDLTENIIHLVLARLPGAPAGIKGISMFLVPKFLPNEDGSKGQRNGLVCTSIEHKMGLKASATAQMSFDDAKGWLVGKPNKGMQAMFVMMNNERLAVGNQGLGIAEAAYQGSVAYARDRLQGRSLGKSGHAPTAADPIIVHPDVRRMLMTMRATTEGCRALGTWVACALEAAHNSTDPEAKKESEDFLALMTPVIKALFTDLGSESANIAVQVYGGHGYIRDHGMEQYVRDARIAQIYEGTNGIQALDLVGRKLGEGNGRLLRTFFHPVSAFIEENKTHPKIGKMVAALERAFGALQKATGYIAATGQSDPENAVSGATDYLRLLGTVALGFMWARAAFIASEHESEAFYKDKLATARFFFERILPQSFALMQAVVSGKESMMAIDESAFVRA